MNIKNVKVAVGMSGGVDSSVAAKMLVDQGFEVIGLMMKFWADESCLACRDNACCDPDSVEDAKRVARQIGIPFYVIDCREEFKRAVADYFIEEYRKHRTPNPCVVCNEKIKFGWFIDFAKKLGCEFVATGHYARILNDSGISNFQFPISKQTSNLQTPISKYTLRLFRGVDEKKDQSYFLHRLSQEQLSRIILPLGELTKEKVRAMAKKWHLPVGEKKESQEVCFIADKDYRKFLKRHLPMREFKPGEIVDMNGSIIGYHQGLLNYTIGQRKGINQTKLVSSSIGLGWAEPRRKYQVSREKQSSSINHRPLAISPKDKQPLYVLAVNTKKNQLIVGEEKDLYSTEIKVENINWIRQVGADELNNLKVKIRYRAEAVACRITNNQETSNKKITIKFNQPQRAITPGQSAVLYKGEEVLGGGVIS